MSLRIPNSLVTLNGLIEDGKLFWSYFLITLPRRCSERDLFVQRSLQVPEKERDCSR
jgi:hypothetical protein